MSYSLINNLFKQITLKHVVLTTYVLLIVSIFYQVIQNQEGFGFESFLLKLLALCIAYIVFCTIDSTDTDELLHCIIPTIVGTTIILFLCTTVNCLKGEYLQSNGLVNFQEGYHLVRVFDKSEIRTFTLNSPTNISIPNKKFKSEVVIRTNLKILTNPEGLRLAQNNSDTEIVVLVTESLTTAMHTFLNANNIEYYTEHKKAFENALANKTNSISGLTVKISIIDFEHYL